MRKKLIISILVLFLSLVSLESNAQCPMCKTSVESAMKDKNNHKGKGLNKGILYLLSIPYLAVGFAGFAWYRNSKRKQFNS